MQLISLQAIPNQTFTIQLDDLLYKITLKTGGLFMFADIIRENVPVILGVRALAEGFLIPYEYLESGNFMFITANQEYPDYRQFESTQFLIYFSQAELEAFRVR